MDVKKLLTETDQWLVETESLSSFDGTSADEEENEQEFIAADRCYVILIQALDTVAISYKYRTKYISYLSLFMIVVSCSFRQYTHFLSFYA